MMMLTGEVKSMRRGLFHQILAQSLSESGNLKLGKAC